MSRFFKHLYLTNRFFWIAGFLVAAFAFTYALPIMLPVIQALLGLGLIATIGDAVFLFNRNMQIHCNRELPGLLSLGWSNGVHLWVWNETDVKLSLTIIDELPAQLQLRDFRMQETLEPRTTRQLDYEVTPVSRGNYTFGATRIFCQSPLGLAERHILYDHSQTLKVYPSVKEMKEYEIKAISSISRFHGVKQLRRMGHHNEFEQIKPYVPGDDYRSINWKATGRKHALMVNQYQDERSQQIYTVLDSGRNMKMPFGGMTLLDYAVNSALAFSNIALSRYDKAGLINFADYPRYFVKAENHQSQLQALLDTLYQSEVTGKESHFEYLYQFLRRRVQGRSLVMLFTNFESRHAFERVLPVLRKINHAHLLITVIFKNEELEAYANGAASDMEEIYTRTIANTFVNEKKEMVHELGKHGIQTVYTTPQSLTLNTINTYLALKARGLI